MFSHSGEALHNKGAWEPVLSGLFSHPPTLGVFCWGFPPDPHQMRRCPFGNPSGEALYKKGA